MPEKMKSSGRVGQLRVDVITAAQAEMWWLFNEFRPATVDASLNGRLAGEHVDAGLFKAISSPTASREPEFFSQARIDRAGWHEPSQLA